MPSYWLTIAVTADDITDAEEAAASAAVQVSGRIIKVQHEPPQGSTIVGDFREDGPL